MPAEAPITIFDSTKFTITEKDYRFAPKGGITDATLLGICQEYRNAVTRRYRTLPARLMATAYQGDTNYIVSLKYDGEGTCFYYDEEKAIAVLISPNSGRARVGLKCVQEAVKQLKASGIKSFLGAAELYLQAKPDEKTCVSDVIHVSYNGTAEERDRLAIAFYDIIMLDRQDVRANQNSYEKTWQKLGTIFGAAGDVSADEVVATGIVTRAPDRVHRVEGYKLKGKEIPAFFEKITGQARGEGIVVRSLTTPEVTKIKPMLTVDGVVVGFVEGEFEGMVGVTSLLVGVTRQGGKIQVVRRVGSGFSDEQRIQLLERVRGQAVEAPLMLADSEGRTITFVEPTFVVEIEGESLEDENYYGRKNLTQLLAWDAKAKKYTFAGMTAIPRLTHATFARFRPEKTWNDGSTRVEQIMPDIMETVKDVTTPSQIVFREVYTKITKEVTSVRKIVVVRHHREDALDYALAYVDYSPGRAEPYDKDIVTTSSPERVWAFIEKYRAECTKKGWVKKEDPATDEIGLKLSEDKKTIDNDLFEALGAKLLKDAAARAAAPEAAAA